MSRIVFGGGVGALAMLAAACSPTVHPPAATSVALPEQFTFQDTRQTGQGGTPIAALLPEHDPGFRALLAQALAEAPDLAVAAARIDAARAGLREAGAALLPGVDLSGQAAQQRISAAQFGGLPGAVRIDPYQGRFSLSADARWEPDLFGRLRATQRSGVARLNAATADATAVRLALVCDIAVALTDLRAIDRQYALLRDDLAQAEAFTALTVQRAHAGLAPDADVLSARAQVERSGGRLTTLEADRAAVIGRLVTLTGLPTDRVLATLATGSRDAASGPVALSPLAISTLALRQRPDVRAAEQRLAAADADIAALAAERYPRFDITAGLGLIALALGDLFTEQAIIGSVGANLSVPLLDFGRVGARLRRSEAAGAEAFAGYRKALFTALGETEAALGGLDAAAKTAAALNQQAALDRESADLAEARYRRGLIGFLEVIAAKRDSLTSQELALLGDADVQRRRIAVYRAVGGAPST
ncbi:efflux transporter outer membrane subunit [Novosphingobium sp.]|uniref:efflux transporter outer membrane subunit n=1 Tax=Novosphingobium sp. TaxID=1874826 RepID=UPI0026353729|nr:efflux transporter outer membrane subunit [Novosphingobium sp.]